MTNKFTYIDLFAGIGGFHIAMKNLGGECVFASEWDEDCRKTYIENFKNDSSKIFTDGQPNNFFVGDITKIDPSSIPDHDVLCAGFPCQPFSQAGYKKGFEDTRGTIVRWYYLKEKNQVIQFLLPILLKQIYHR